MEKIVRAVSMDEASEKRLQPLSEREVLEVSGGANSRQVFINAKRPNTPVARPSRQNTFG